MIIEFKTQINTQGFNKPNEDYYLCDKKNNIYIVVDGVTRDKVNGIYPIPSESAIVSRIAVETIHKFISLNKKTYSNYCMMLYDAVVKGNNEIYYYNLAYKGDFLPSTVGIVVFIDNKKLYFAYIGDCYGIMISDLKRTIFTECQTEKINKHKREFTANQIRNEICNNINHPYSYGTLNGCKGAKDFIKTGVISLDFNTKIFLFSDGLASYILGLSIEELMNYSVDEIIKNSIHSVKEDDKTIITIIV